MNKSSTQAVPARWYVIDNDGHAVLCEHEPEARDVAKEMKSLWPQKGYKAVLLAPVEQNSQSN